MDIKGEEGTQIEQEIQLDNQIKHLIDEDQSEQMCENMNDSEDKIQQEGMEFEKVSANQDIDESNIDDDDNSSNDQELMPRAIPINSMSDIDSNHTDYEGLQYLLNVIMILSTFFQNAVRKEANKTSNIMIAKNVNVIETETDMKYIPQSTLKGEFQHSKLTPWEQDQIIQFKSFKKHLEYVDEQILKGVNPQEIISNYYNGLEDDKYVKSKKCFVDNFMNEDLTKIVIPSTQTLQKITYIRLEKMFEYIDQLINDKLELLESIQHDVSNPNIHQLYHDKKVFLNYHQYLWIYALMGRLDNPILADISCILNKILQISVFQQKHFSKDREDYQMVIAMTSMIIVIIREYYGQKYVSI